ncbi:uncharacterized protein M6B38_383710 [Iris pallida]|uniref:RING-type domain-containing protein n=1 Tax=Iris pallida TaxID=29817 RepID=A0AAX6G4M1_IRIPA|nr:uncharacterized protein M6B38_383710 [Iris pallida]
MGNKIGGRRRQVVDDRYTRPQGLYQHRDIDHKKLRRLILDSKLAPCFPGDDDDGGGGSSGLDLEECPICFLYYPSLNRSRCCMKGICTECFLQMKPPHSTRPTQCPFCKTSNYAVEYRGVRTKEEKGIEKFEEQKVIEAQIRMRQQELQDAEERTQKKQEISSSSRIMAAGEVEYPNVSNSSVQSFRYPTQGNDIISSQGPFTAPVTRQHSYSRQNREANFDLDLEDIMVMEAIWLSIQEGGQRNPPVGASEHSHVSYSTEASPSGGLACTVAAFAESQHMSGDLANVAGSSNPVFDTLQKSGCLTAREERMVQSYPSERWVEVSPDSGRAEAREEEDEGEWSAEDHGSEVAEAGTSYASSDVAVNAAGASLSIPEGSFNMPAGHLLPESFEEQMMLAMAVSLAEARARTNPQGVTWM